METISSYPHALFLLRLVVLISKFLLKNNEYTWSLYKNTIFYIINVMNKFAQNKEISSGEDANHSSKIFNALGTFVI